jgi:hypothetical protein
MDESARLSVVHLRGRAALLRERAHETHSQGLADTYLNMAQGFEDQAVVIEASYKVTRLRRR